MDWWLRNRGDYQGSQDRDIERSCTSKDAYPTEEHARAHAIMNGMAERLSAYRCVYCESWHLTSQKRS